MHLLTLLQIVTDLLDPNNSNLKIHESSGDQIVVGSLSEKIVVSPEEMLTYMHEGRCSTTMRALSYSHRARPPLPCHWFTLAHVMF